MKNIKSIMVGLGLVATFGLGGCGDDLGKVKKLKDKACACKDAACVEGVMKEMKDLKVKDNDDTKKVVSELMTCVMKLSMPAGAPAAK